MQVSSTRRSLLLLPGLLLLACAGMVNAQQDETPPGSMPSAGQAPGGHMTHTVKTDNMVNMHGMHTMPATVTNADPKTGIVDVTTEGMALRVHFPPASMVNLKTGDKIGLYMGYSQANIVK